MRIALDEIDPHIAALYADKAPAQPANATPRRPQRPRLSRRRHMALVASLVAPPILGAQFATFVERQLSYSIHGLFWIVWFGTWAIGTSLGCRVTLKGRLASRRSAALTYINALVAPTLGFAAAITFAGAVTGFSFFAFCMVWLAVSLPAALVGNHIALNTAPQRESITTLQAENLRDVFGSLSLTRTERVYCDVLQFLSRAQPNVETEQTMRETLRQLNDLMQSSRQLEEQRLSLLPLLGANVVPELRAEYDRLKQRLDAANDQITRASLEQSRRMVLSRIDDAHSLQTGLERLNTQQEAIAQTLSSTLSALGRMQLTADARPEFAMNDIAETVTQMNQQTIAVESAVEEVLTLRAFN